VVFIDADEPAGEHGDIDAAAARSLLQSGGASAVMLRLLAILLM
jgi:hypothetical protein